MSSTVRGQVSVLLPFCFEWVFLPKSWDKIEVLLQDYNRNTMFHDQLLFFSNTCVLPHPASQTSLEKSEQMPRLHSLSSWFKVLGKISQTFPGWTKFPSIWTEHVGHCAHSAWSGIMTLSPLVSDKAGPLWSTADFCLCHLLLALSPNVPCHTASAPLV